MVNYNDDDNDDDVDNSNDDEDDCAGSGTRDDDDVDDDDDDDKINSFYGLSQSEIRKSILNSFSYRRAPFLVRKTIISCGRRCVFQAGYMCYDWHAVLIINTIVITVKQAF